MNEEKYSLEDLNLDEINIIFAGIRELPLKVSMHLFMKLHEQMHKKVPHLFNGGANYER